MAEQAKILPPPVIAIAAWVLPGSGHILAGDITRGVTIGATILFLFIAGLFIGGVRVLEVPGFDDNGQRTMLTVRDARGNAFVDSNGQTIREWALTAAPVGEIRAKPWSIAQVLTGPVSFGGAIFSVMAAQPDPVTKQPIGTKSHVRLNEIGTLYTAVAGMLNLLAIIDAASRASRARA